MTEHQYPSTSRVNYCSCSGYQTWSCTDKSKGENLGGTKLVEKRFNAVEPEGKWTCPVPRAVPI